jgi:hypothetical protein
MGTIWRPVTSILAAIVCLLWVSQTKAQDYEKKVRMRDLPKPVQRTVREQSRNATLRGLTKEVEKGKTYFEAELRINGHSKDVLIDPTGVVVEIEEEVPLNSLTAEVRAAIEKSAGNGRIVYVESITKNGTVVAYEAHIEKAGKRSEVKVSSDGEVLPSEG